MLTIMVSTDGNLELSTNWCNVFAYVFTAASYCDYKIAVVRAWV